MNSQEILQLLDQSTEDLRPTVRRLRSRAHVADLIMALEAAESESNRTILCDLLGYHHSKSAIPLLIEHLEDVSPNVRSSAADALAKIGDIRAGKALLRRFELETDSDVKQMLAAALGAVGYKSAVPKLIEAIGSSDATLRGCAAWSLGALKATNAVNALQSQLVTETDSYSLQQLTDALRKLGESL